jgi:hypothetical protein
MLLTTTPRAELPQLPPVPQEQPLALLPLQVPLP